MTYPSSPTFKAINFKSVSPTMGSKANSGKSLDRRTASQYFKFSASYPSLTKLESRPLFAFLAAQEGEFGRFTIVLPEISYKSGDASGFIVAAAPASIGAKSVSISGLLGTLKAGDLVRFSGHSKVYLITADLTGAGALSFTPSLRSSVASSEPVIYDAVDFTVKQIGDTQEFKLSGYENHRINVDFEELL